MDQPRPRPSRRDKEEWQSARLLSPLWDAFADRKGITDQPAPCSVRLSARDFNRVQRRRVHRWHFPIRMHQRDLARIDNLPDLEIEDGFGGSKRSQLLPD